MIKIFYWSPHINQQIATTKAVINSAYGLYKYSNKKFSSHIINVFGEWNSFKDEILSKNVNLINLTNYTFKLPKNGYLNSRFFYIIISLISIFPLYKLLKKEKPEYFIIHLITTPVLILIFFFNFNTKFILRISGYPKLNFFRKTLWKLSSKHLYIVFCPTNGSKDILIDKKIFNEDKLFLLEDPIIEIRSLPKLRSEKINFSEINSKYILAAGRLTKQKNFNFLINSFSKLKKVNKILKLVIIGSGEEKCKLNQLIQKLNMEDRILIYDYKKNIYNYMFNCEFFILTSLWEDPGFVLIESAANNKLILSNNCLHGPKDFIDNNKNGYLMEINNFEQFQQNIDYIVNNYDSIDIKKKILNAKIKAKNYTIFQHYKKLKTHLFLNIYK